MFRPIFLVSMVAVGVSAQANLLVNGDFEADLYGANSAPSIETLTGWGILGPGDVHGVGAGYLGAPSQQVDVSGYADVAGSGIEQVLATLPGQQYTLQFDFFVDGLSGAMKVEQNATVLAASVSSTGTYSYSFVGTGTDTIRFVNLGLGNVAHVDNASVEAVPEPATLAVLALGGAAVARRRRSK